MQSKNGRSLVVFVRRYRESLVVFQLLQRRLRWEKNTIDDDEEEK
jgi:hypothetical protein